MTPRLSTLSANATARLAGVGYLILAVCGGFAEFGVRQRFVVPGDAAATAQNLLANAPIWRLGIVERAPPQGQCLARNAQEASALDRDVATGILNLLKSAGHSCVRKHAFALFDLLKNVHRKRAVTMRTLVIIAVTITCLNLANQAAALFVHGSGPWSAALDPAQLEALSRLFLDLHFFGYSVVAQVFFGLWLVPLGVLIWDSGFLPRVIGALLIVAGAGYLVDVVVAIMVPSAGFVLSEFTFVGELLLLGWLLIRGVDERRFRARQLGAAPSPA